MRHEAREQHRAPDDADDQRRSQSPRGCGRRTRARAGRWHNRRRRRWRRSCRGRRGEDQPCPEPADHDHEAGHQRQPAGAVQRDDRAQEQERHRVVDQVLEARVDERRGQDPPETRDVAGVDAVAVEAVGVERVDDLDQPHAAATIPASRHEALDRCSLRSAAEHRRARSGSAPSVDAHTDRIAARATASATAIRAVSEPSCTNSSGVCAPPPRGPRPSIVSGIMTAK